MRFSIDEIAGYTGFDRGEKFTSAHEVREYFQLDVMEDIYPGWQNETGCDQDDLDKMADIVISTKTWME